MPTPYFGQPEGQHGAVSGTEGKGYYAPVGSGYGDESHAFREGIPTASPRMHEVEGASVPQQLYGSETGHVAELP